MKILAFSDWRKQPLEMIQKIVEIHKPDLILYAGDDLNRFIGLDRTLLLKIANNFIELNYPSLQPILKTQRKLLTKQFRNELRKFLQGNLESDNFLRKLGVPFYYVNGNDHATLYRNNNYYIQLNHRRFNIEGEYYNIKETPEGKLTIEGGNRFITSIGDSAQAKELNSIDRKLNRYETNPDNFSIKDGIYLPMAPNFGDFLIQNKNEKITIFGFECESGAESDIINNPENYTDIYLSHIPPKGVLDLSGTHHIGSQKLLDAINKHHPKLVICGHSHVWGGLSTRIGDTLVINISSHDNFSSPGNYALIDTYDLSRVEIKIVEDKTKVTVRGINTIKSNIRKKIMDIMKDVTNVNMNKVHEIESIYDTVKQWGRLTSYERSLVLKKVENFGVDTKRIQERLETIAFEEPKIKRNITINPTKCAFVDAETGLFKSDKEPGKLWLIGLWYNEDFMQFEFPNGEKEFLNYIKQNYIDSLVSWTRYDIKALEPVLKKANIAIDFIDACQRTSNCVIWHTYQLHELYNAFFPHEKDKENLISGYIAGLYADHLIIPNNYCPYCPPREEIIDQIKKRNRMDIYRMVKICFKLNDYRQGRISEKYAQLFK